MSPEQARGDEIRRPMRRLRGGRDALPDAHRLPAVRRGDAAQRAHRASHVGAHPARDRAPERGISPALEAVVLHAMAKNPADRYSTAAEMAAAILHARARPATPSSVHPESFRVRLDGDGEVDGHGPTSPICRTPPPAPLHAHRSPRSPRASSSGRSAGGSSGLSPRSRASASASGSRCTPLEAGKGGGVHYLHTSHIGPRGPAVKSGEKRQWLVTHFGGYRRISPCPKLVSSHICGSFREASGSGAFAVSRVSSTFLYGVLSGEAWSQCRFVT